MECLKVGIFLGLAVITAQLKYSSASVLCTPDELHDAVKAHYARIAEGDTVSSFSPDCLSNSTKFCNPNRNLKRAKELGYSKKEFNMAKSASYGLGCGNPVAAADLQEGEVVVDLGSGTGFDALIAAEEVGIEGNVIGVDITPEMVDLAKANAKKMECTNVEFRDGSIEDAPVDDEEADVVLSNCVFNVLHPDHKADAINEVYRILKPGGRMVFSTLLGKAEEGVEVMSPEGECCYLGVTMEDEMEELLEEAGFENIEFFPEDGTEIEEGGLTMQAFMVTAERPN